MKARSAVVLFLTTLVCLHILSCGAAPLLQNGLKTIDSLVKRGTMDWEDWVACFRDTCREGEAEVSTRVRD